MKDGAQNTDAAVRLTVFARPGAWDGAFTPAEQFAPALAERLADCDAVVILHPLAFPWEHYRRALARKVVYVYLAGDDLRLFDSGAFDAVFAMLTPYDRIVASVARKRLERAWDFAPTLKVPAGEPGDAVSACAQDWASRNHTPASELQKPEGNPTGYWQERAAVFGENAPEKTVGSIAHSLNANKRMHIAQSKAFLPVFDAIKRNHVWRAVEMGCGTGRILKELSRLGAEVTGIDASVEILSAARNFVPEATLIHASISSPDILPRSEFDAAVFVTVFHHLSEPAKASAIRNALHALRPGGYLVLLEDFASVRSTDAAITMPLSITEFVAFVVAQSRGALSLVDLRTVAYEHVPEVRSAVVAFRLGGTLEAE